MAKRRLTLFFSVAAIFVCINQVFVLLTWNRVLHLENGPQPSSLVPMLPGNNEKMIIKPENNNWRKQASSTRLGFESLVKITHRTNLLSPILEEYKFDYPEFGNIPEPNFLPATHHREQFYRYKPPNEWWNMSSNTRVGYITVVQYGTYDHKDDCGYRGNYTRHFPKNHTTITPGKIVALDDTSAVDFSTF